MRLRRNLCNRRVRNCLRKLQRSHLYLLLIVLALILVPLIWIDKSTTDFSYCQPIDVVYTWVNGTDSAFIESIRRFMPNFDPARYDDKNELRYSLRSLELYAPWVRHVYIVTNGQIPNWLDLSYERVTVVPHEVLAPERDRAWLPTFSSAAIETFVHRIPKLSQRFLYLNDDIFLGAPLYPEDLYTDSEGVRIYQAWMVPDCAEECPWTYIGDGACDLHCNIAPCQFDGGDCSTEAEMDAEGMNVVDHKLAIQLKTLKPPVVNVSRQRVRKRGRSSTFKDIMKQKNITSPSDLHKIVSKFNTHIKTHQHNAAPSTEGTMLEGDAEVEEYKSTKDIYSQSLINTNMLLNRHYGFRARNVPAHVGFLLDRQIIEEMQAKFKTDIARTAAHRFREPTDLQFAFAYYTYVMSETRTATVREIFDEFDTDGSQTWSDREIRTFLARMYPPPLDWSSLHYFEEVINNCSHILGLDKPTQHIQYTTLVYERYEDSNLPAVTRDLVANCNLLAEAMTDNFGTRNKYRFVQMSRRVSHNNFMMLTSNVSEVVEGLDKIRRSPKKFNCINDNLEPQNTADNEFVRHLLEDFYLSFFPRRSKYELPPEYRNRFANWSDYQRWRRRKRGVLVIGYTASAILLIFVFRFLCSYKAKFARRYIQRF